MIIPFVHQYWDDSIKMINNESVYLFPGYPSLYLLCKHELKHCNTDNDVKFSLAIISNPLLWRSFSFLIRSVSSGSFSHRFECKIFDEPDIFLCKTNCKIELRFLKNIYFFFVIFLIKNSLKSLNKMFKYSIPKRMSFTLAIL